MSYTNMGNLHGLLVLVAFLTRTTLGALVQQMPVSPITEFRELQPHDIPALATLLITAFSQGALYHYVVPDFPTHYTELWCCLNASLTYAWNTRDRSTTLGRIIAVKDTPVSVAIWNIRNNDQEPVEQTAFQQLGTDCGINTTREQDYERQYEEIQHKHFTSVYPRQFYLNTLATHPSWDGHGFAAKHVVWGKKVSRQFSNPEWPVTLLATPAGWPLYHNLGFKSVENVTAKMLDGLGDLWFEVMEWSGQDNFD
jgi:hypothetical protein